jgi:hypothetical protein
MPRTEGALSTASQAPMLQRVWLSMRVLRQFTRGDLIATAEAGQTAVERYVRVLRDAGYVRLVAERVSGRPGSSDRLALVRDSGPLAPIPRKKGGGAYDPNTLLTWDAQGRSQRAEPPVLKLSQAQRLALVQAGETGGVVKATFESLQGLVRLGLVQVHVTLTPYGDAAARQLGAARNQREGRALAAHQGVTLEDLEAAHA